MALERRDESRGTGISLERRRIRGRADNLRRLLKVAGETIPDLMDTTTAPEGR